MTFFRAARPCCKNASKMHSRSHPGTLRRPPGEPKLSQNHPKIFPERSLSSKRSVRKELWEVFFSHPGPFSSPASFRKDLLSQKDLSGKALGPPRLFPERSVCFPMQPGALSGKILASILPPLGKAPERPKTMTTAGPNAQETTPQGLKETRSSTSGRTGVGGRGAAFR